MPLGASITAGVGTHPQDARLAWNGYRKPLRDQLRWRGWAVNMVGSGADGDAAGFHNRQHEGHPGFVVTNMTTVADNTIPRKPNVVLINCGTNDAAYNGNKQPLVYTTGTRMRGVLNHLFGNIEGVTVVLSTLLPRKDSSKANVVLAEFNSNNLLDPNTDYRDNIHPNVGGAAKLAAVWDLAILEAERKGFLSPPANTGWPDYSPDGSNDNTSCELAKGGTASLRGPIRTQQGWGYDDGSYVHAEPGDANYRDVTPYFYKLESSFNWDTNSLAFAQLVNVNHVLPGAGERDDLVHCNDTDTGPSSPFAICNMILNVDGYVNEEPVQLNTGLKCHARGVRWGDVNGDGLDDFICINAAGNMYVALNRGGNPPEFEPAANGGLIRTGESWCSQDRVRLGDMDGDGRLDYCCIDGQGDIYCWRNGGQGDTPTAADGGYWQSLVPGAPTFLAQHESEGVAGVHLVDINGDHRSDWVYVYKDGSTKIFINQRGSYDDDGPGLRPHWVRATAEHPALSALQRGRTSGIIFGRLDGTGRADRVVLYHSANDLSLGYYITLQAYKNNGHGGTKRKGDGVFYCDMFGRGRDDYLWVLSTGEITLFENIQSPPNWGQHGVIIDINRDRKSIHFGRDWDGDGKCDILSVDRESGYVDMWRNKYRAGDRSPTFEAPKTVVGSGALGSSVRLCHEGWGWGLYDQGVRFADLDGDGRVDYICMEPDGRSIGHLNKADDFEFKGQIKFAPSEHLDRANFKWADVTGDGKADLIWGDGKADLIWVNKFDGAARVWKNGGFTPAGGSSMTWIDQGFLFKGHGRGQNIHFPILGHEGRADYHDVYPGTAIANTWFNECPSSNGEGVDDYPVPINPHLPSVLGSDHSESAQYP
ncbi:carbohydrate esterase [Rhypophila decipiens]|uniref:Carbohydrate esterase n=1 Tax=Rhypophila decipiens TaxID=261697 RepID=A0AAN6Y114_9PEZI|nr:carbohydrate esterase [Rhypophila decipiens]